MIPLALASFAFCCLGSYASFTDSIRQGRWYVPLMTWVCLATGTVFACGAQWLDDKQRVFVFSLYCDIAMVGAYYLLPILFFGVRPSPWIVVSAVLVALAIAAAHWGAHDGSH